MKKIRHIAFILGGILIAVLLPLLVNAIALDSKTDVAIDVAIDFAAVLIGIVLSVYIIITLKSFTGYLRKSYEFILYGVVLNVLALLEHALMDLGVQVVPLPFDTHHILMAIGLLFFGVATYYLRKMMSELKQKK